MREPRNPFRMRTSEQIESDATFLRLFGPGVLGVLPDDSLWDRVLIFRSAPGAGKTSLFRVFTPNALLTLHGYRANPDYKELYNRMKQLEVISDSGPELLGMMLSCAKNYDILEDLELGPGHKDRLFFSLLNARLILATLRSAISFAGLSYPEDLKRLKFIPTTSEDFANVPIPGSGDELYNWSRSIENNVCKLSDSFNPAHYSYIEGCGSQQLFSLLRPEGILVDGHPIAKRSVLMLDDLHKLTKSQRQKLLSVLIDQRSLAPVWVSERLEPLRGEELLSSGSTSGREYQEIKLEAHWRDNSSKQFEALVLSIADKRCLSSYDVSERSFSAIIEEELDERKCQTYYAKAISVISQRVRDKSRHTKRYDNIVFRAHNAQGLAKDVAIEWKIAEILIERDLRQQQLFFDFGEVLDDKELIGKDPSGLRATAEYFLAREFNIPYYFTVARVVALASYNIDQFLAFSGDIFEEVRAATVLGHIGPLSAERQEAILKKCALERWEEIERKIRNGRDVAKLLQEMARCARWETNRPNAPYAPGVTGIAISMDDRRRLLDPLVRQAHPEYNRLLSILSACILNNLLLPEMDRRQGGNRWMILNLNRWLCVQFGLPLQYGGWRPKKLDELCAWLKEGFKVPSRKGGGEYRAR